MILDEQLPDGQPDAEATLRAFKKAGMANPIFHCKDGDEALDYLRQQGKYADPAKAPRPGMILLDLNMPGTDGREVLAAIKADENLRQIPVIVLTTSSDERDIQVCYRDGANSYIQKPVDMKGFLESIQRLVDYWYHIVLLPKGAR